MPGQNEKLFQIPPKNRAKRRVMMYVCDAGEYPANGPIRGEQCDCCFKCRKCGKKVDWVRVQNTTEGKRGIPCSVCNHE